MSITTDYYLTERDHTNIISFVIKNIIFIISELKISKASFDMHKPTGIEILTAALKVKDIDRSLEDSITAVIEISKKMDQDMGSLSTDIKSKIDEIRKTLDNVDSLPDKVNALNGMLEGNVYGDFKGINTGIQAAIRILKDGSNSLYSNESGIGVIYESSGGTAGGIISTDAGGAVVGGALGSLAGGAGAGPGALGGAVTASTAKAVEDVVDWFIDLF